MKTNTYPKPDNPIDGRDAVAKLEEIASAAKTAGIDLPPAVADGAALIERCQRWKTEARELTEDRQTATRRITRALVDGDLDLEGAAAEAARVEAMQSGGVFARAVAASETVAARRAFEEIGATLDGEAVLTEARGVCEQTVAEIRKLRKALAGIGDDAAAAKAGPKVASAWSKYQVELIPRFNASHRLIELLRALHWVQPLPVGLSARAYARPDAIREARLDAKRGGKAWLPILDTRDDDAQPGGPFRAEELRVFDGEAAVADHEAEAVAAEASEGLLRVVGVQR